MKRKRIEALPVPAVKKGKKGNVIAAEAFDDTLVLFCYREKTGYYGRYCIRKSGEYAAYIDGEWCVSKLVDMFSQVWAWALSSRDFDFNDAASEKTAEEFADSFNVWGKEFGSRIANAESEYLRDKREKAFERKKERIRADIMKVKPLPAEFKDWAVKTVFGDREYAFYDKAEDRYLCTACGKAHKINDGKHNGDYLCRRSGKAVVIKRRVHGITEKEHCMVLQPFDDKRFCARHFTLECNWYGNKRTLQIYEDIRYILSKDGIGKNRFYYGQCLNKDEFSQLWFDSNPINKRCWMEYCYPANVREVLHDTCYNSLGIAEMAEKGWKVFYNKLMTAYSDGKFFEYLVKGGYERLTQEIIYRIWFNYFPEYIFPSGRNAAEVLKIDGQQVARLRQRNGGIITLCWLQYEKRSGNKLSDEVLLSAERYELYPSNVDSELHRLSPVKIIHYIEKQSKLSHDTVNQTLTTWKDYRSMAARLNISLESDMLYRPKDLKAAHDELVNRINLENDKKERARLKRLYPGVSKICKSLNLYEWQDEQYAVVAPKDVLDIMQEGRNLNHCVGTSDRYFERIKNRESYILFLRRTENITQSYYTLEVEPGGVIRQKRTTGDRQKADIKEATEFLKKWQRVISGRLSENEKSLADKSKLARKAEFRELRENGNIIRNGIFAGKLLVDVLEADLMEIETA